MAIESCLCCLSLNIKTLPAADGFEHSACLCCGYEHFSRADHCATSSLYEQDLDYSADLDVCSDAADLLQWQHHVALKMIATMKKLNPDLHVFDVGCFNGFFVRTLIDRGVDAFGIDFNNVAVQYGQDRYMLKDRVICGDVDSILALGNKYEVITLFELLEHLEDPSSFLKTIGQILSDNGHVVMSVPNKKMIWRPKLDNPPHHLSRFTRKSLQCLLEGAGFTSVTIHEQMNLYNLIRNYIGSLLRSKHHITLRGGELPRWKVILFVKRCLNKLRRSAYLIMYPLDKVLYFLGIRYISMVAVAHKISDTKAL